MSAQPFTIQSKHGLVSCIDYAKCANVFANTERWGEYCENCIRNKYRRNQESLLAPPDNFKPLHPELFSPASAVKEQLIAEVVMKLEELDNSVLVPGCTVLLEISLDGATVNIDVINNLLIAKQALSQAVEHIMKATAIIVKSPEAKT